MKKRYKSLEAQLKERNKVTNILEVVREEVAMEKKELREALKKFFTKLNEIQDYQGGYHQVI
jgi:hypothetical protein